MTKELKEHDLELLRCEIDGVLREHDIYGRVREILKDHSGISRDEAMRMLEGEGILRELAESLRPGASVQAVGTEDVDIDAQIDSSRTYLLLHVLSGSDFTPSESHNLLISFHFSHQRWISSPVKCEKEPIWRQRCLLRIPVSSSHELLHVNEPLDICVISEEKNGARRRVLIGSETVDWRRVLCEKGGRAVLAVRVEESVLQIQVEIVPRLAVGAEVSEEEFSGVSGSLIEKEGLAKEKYVGVARDWWREYISRVGEESHVSSVRVMVRDETGEVRPVTTFVSCDHQRVVESPRAALRAVTLLPKYTPPPLGDIVWRNHHVVWSVGRATETEKSCILVSLLRGMGMNAYVVLGTRRGGRAGAWAVIVSIDGKSVFWDPVNGVRVEVSSEPSEMYRSVDVVFRDDSFFARVPPGSYFPVPCDFKDKTSWVGIPKEVIDSWPNRTRSGVVLPPPNLSSVIDTSKLFERALKGHLSAYLGREAQWDNGLCNVLGHALASYEADRVGMRSKESDEEFGDAVKRSVPSGHTFQAVPMQFLESDAAEVLAAWLKHPAARVLLDSPPRGIVYAIRVRFVYYTDRSCAVWVMLAAYFPHPQQKQ